MYKDKKVYGIIGAAGKGSRMAASIPKQFLKIGDKTILEKTFSKMEKSKYIDEIIIVVEASYRDFCQRFFADFKGKSLRVVTGGKERQDSIYEGLKSIECKELDQALVIIHDGARPYAKEELFDRVVERAYEAGGATAAIKTKDTIKDIEKGILDRSKLYNIQTPQGFKGTILKEAMEKAKTDGYYGTDESSLVERVGYKVELVQGDEGNIKITTKEDLQVEWKVGCGYDVHQLVENRKLILGGVTIDYERGLLGHSDADVLTHALMDALLGAAGLGDIGCHFPDTSEEYKGISSIKLLKEVKLLIEKEGFSLGNADITVICQAPKISKHIEKMKANLEKALNTKGTINIKATTTEKLGFVGRSEGISCEAVCLLNKNK